MSGNGIEANEPKRPGWSRTSCAAYSFDSRAILREPGTSPAHACMPGLMSEVIEVAMPLLSMSSSEASTDHLAWPRIMALSAAE